MSKANNYFQRQRIGLAVVGGIMTLMVAFSLTPTFAGVVATITNSVNTASTDGRKEPGRISYLYYYWYW